MTVQKMNIIHDQTGPLMPVITNIYLTLEFRIFKNLNFLLLFNIQLIVTNHSDSNMLKNVRSDSFHLTACLHPSSHPLPTLLPMSFPGSSKHYSTLIFFDVNSQFPSVKESWKMCLSGPDLFRGPPLSWLSISPRHRKTIALSIHPSMNTKIDSYLGFPEVSHKHTSLPQTSISGSVPVMTSLNSQLDTTERHLRIESW